MKTVTLPIEEYEELMQDQKDKQRLMEEIEADADERGFFVQYITQCWRKNDEYGWEAGYDFIREKNVLKIISKDEVLADAQKEIDRLSALCVELSVKMDTITIENAKLKGRGFLARLLNKED